MARLDAKEVKLVHSIVGGCLGIRLSKGGFVTSFNLEKYLNKTTTVGDRDREIKNLIDRLNKEFNCNIEPQYLMSSLYENVSMSVFTNVIDAFKNVNSDKLDVKKLHSCISRALNLKKTRGGLLRNDMIYDYLDHNFDSAHFGKLQNEIEENFDIVIRASKIEDFFRYDKTPLRSLSDYLEGEKTVNTFPTHYDEEKEFYKIIFKYYSESDDVAFKYSYIEHHPRRRAFCIGLTQGKEGYEISTSKEGTSLLPATMVDRFIEGKKIANYPVRNLLHEFILDTILTKLVNYTPFTLTLEKYKMSLRETKDYSVTDMKVYEDSAKDLEAIKRLSEIISGDYSLKSFLNKKGIEV